MKDNVSIPELVQLLKEAREWVTDKPWDDPTYLHMRISKALNLAVSYADWDYENKSAGAK